MPEKDVMFFRKKQCLKTDVCYAATVVTEMSK